MELQFLLPLPVVIVVSLWGFLLLTLLVFLKANQTFLPGKENYFRPRHEHSGLFVLGELCNRLGKFLPG